MKFLFVYVTRPQPSISIKKEPGQFLWRFAMPEKCCEDLSPSKYLLAQSQQ